MEQQKISTRSIWLHKLYKITTTPLRPIEEESEADLIEEELLHVFNAIKSDTMKNNKCFKSRLKRYTMDEELLKVTFKKTERCQFITSLDETSPLNASSQHSQPSFVCSGNQEGVRKNRLIHNPAQTHFKNHRVIFSSIREKKMGSNILDSQAIEELQSQNKTFHTQSKVKVIRNPINESRKAGKIIKSRSQINTAVKIRTNKEHPRLIIKTIRHFNTKTNSTSQYNTDTDELVPLVQKLIIFSNKCQ